ncbi:hypothetical protein CVT26_015218 [Gymnopilus dilepis]|uniref:F-box domain-containing protein n=1 Tax=Gymnopilus dilepis TaxID=231916 RepID=A0A409W3Z2_9AGAR|nr:hypothetical protein CVT26_015218 [Gymnopilus dilepis]
MATELLPELIDLVIERLADISNQDERTKALSSAALVSRALRYQAHRYLFAKVILATSSVPPRLPSHVVKRLQSLCDLMCADPNTTMTGVASYISTFEVYISGSFYESSNRGQAYLKPTTTILKKIFKTGTSPCSLSLSFPLNYASPARWPKYPDLMVPLLEICKNPRLVSLHLSYIADVPLDLLKDSSVKHLSLERISIGPQRSISSMEQTSEFTEHLESLSTDLSYARVTAPDSLHDNRILYFPCSLSKLKFLNIDLHFSDDFRLKSVATMLDASSSTLTGLAISLQAGSSMFFFKSVLQAILFINPPSASLGPESRILRLRDLIALKKLLLKSYTVLSKSTTTSILADFSAVLNVEQDGLPEALEKLQISFTIDFDSHRFKDDPDPALTDLHRNVHELDLFLSRICRLSRLRSLTISVSVPVTRIFGPPPVDILEKYRMALFTAFANIRTLNFLEFEVITTSASWC